MVSIATLPSVAVGIAVGLSLVELGEGFSLRLIATAVQMSRDPIAYRRRCSSSLQKRRWHFLHLVFVHPAAFWVLYNKVASVISTFPLLTS